MESVTTMSIIDAYEKYHAAGFSCVPTSKAKSPAVPKGTELKGNWSRIDEYKNSYGIGIWCGNGLECIDIDNHFKDALENLEEYSSKPEIAEIFNKYNFPIQSTVSGGYHILYKCKQVDGSKKLASRFTDLGEEKALFETRGNNNYFCIEPTPGYKLLKDYGDIFNLPVITPEERETLFEAARSFNEVIEEHTITTTGNKPGDIYNNSPASITEAKQALRDAGWVETDDYNWRRPGKDKGCSATFGKVAPNVFNVFSTSAHPFNLGGYKPFQIVALLKYKGDFSKFTSDLVLKQKSESNEDYEKLRIKLQIDPGADVEKPPTFCFIDGRPSLTKGNFSLWDGKKKAGKTFIIGGTVAAMLNNSVQIGKIHGNLPSNKNMILYFDTEQSTYHANRSVKRICLLAGVRNPGNLLAFGLRPLTPAERLSFIEKTITITPGLGCVVVDGIRDLLTMGINDEAEATTLTSKFLKWTEYYDMHMILVLHQNKNDFNARGHIGTEIGNKAETIIAVAKDKDNDLFMVSCEDSKDIGFSDFGFIVDDDGLIQPMSIPEKDSRGAKNPKYVDDQKHFEVLDRIFRNNKSIQRPELTDAIVNGFDGKFGDSTCRKYIAHYLEKEWLTNTREGMRTFYTYNRATF